MNVLVHQINWKDRTSCHSMAIKNNLLNILVKLCMHRKSFPMLKVLCSCVKQRINIRGNWITVQLHSCGEVVVSSEGLNFESKTRTSLVYVCLFEFEVCSWEISNRLMTKMKHWKICFWISFLLMRLINVKKVGEKLLQLQRSMVFQFLVWALVNWKNENEKTVDFAFWF